MTVATSMSASSSSQHMSKGRHVIFHWFRHGDLRIHDNPALAHTSKLAISSSSSLSSINSTAASAASDGSSVVVIPVFCFDTKKIFGNDIRTPFGSMKCGPRRAKFTIECVTDLRQQLQSIGSNLVVTHGNEPADVFDRLISAVTTNMKNDQGTRDDDTHVTIVCQEEPLKEEKDAVESVRSVLRKRKKEKMTNSGKKDAVVTIWGSTMYELEDLPFSDGLVNMPDVFTPFRNKVEKNCKIPRPLQPPSKGVLNLPTKDSLLYSAIANDLINMPTLSDLGYTEEQIKEVADVDERSVLNFVGGESVALARVREYIWDKDLLRIYFDTRNGMIGGDYSSKFSPWLALGCLSARYVAQQCKLYEERVIANKSTYWLVFELIWRDYCKFFCLKHGNKVFYPGGIIDSKKRWSVHDKDFITWRDGMTGYPLVDANMRELKATGFMSNRGRQNVCSFLAHELNHDWRYGADWFESNLLDYDVYSNWVNWVAGAGMTGGRLNRFSIVKQSKDYDQHGNYVKLWLPELKNVPTEYVHEPRKMTHFQQVEYDIRLGVDYPNPFVKPFAAATATNSKEGGRGKNQNEGRQQRKGHDSGGRQRKPNRSNRNRDQKYEMKSVSQGSYQMK